MVDPNRPVVASPRGERSSDFVIMSKASLTLLKAFAGLTAVQCSCNLLANGQKRSGAEAALCSLPPPPLVGSASLAFDQCDLSLSETQLWCRRSLTLNKAGGGLGATVLLVRVSLQSHGLVGALHLPMRSVEALEAIQAMSDSKSATISKALNL